MDQNEKLNYREWLYPFLCPETDLRPIISTGLESWIQWNMGLSRNETIFWTEEHMETNQTTDAFGPEVVIVPVIFGCIFFLGIIGNTLVMVVIGKIKSRRSRSTTNIFILNLSIADLCFLLFCVPFHATIYSLPEWIFGAFLCKFVHYFLMVSMLVSIFTLVAMSVDRYIAVVLSKKSPCIRNRRNALIGVCVIWMLSFIFAVPVAQHQILMDHPKAPNSSFCWEIWTERVAKHTYKVTILVIGYLLPLVLITCCYAKVWVFKHYTASRIIADTFNCKVAIFLILTVYDLWVDL